MNHDGTIAVDASNGTFSVPVCRLNRAFRWSACCFAFPLFRVQSVLTLLLSVIVACLGCDAETHFEPNAALRATHRLTAEQEAFIDGVLTELFGTPSEPQLPEEITSLDLAALTQAAGPVISYEPGVTQGLFRRHCARCHGVTGDGKGPASYYQHPYPRDFRQGVFKWKSTYHEVPPTNSDLLSVIERGIPGTAMPSFQLLTPKERDMLRQYVIYLAMRGQLERELIWLVAEEFGPGETLPEDEALSIARELLQPIVKAWVEAPSAIVLPNEAALPPASTESIQLGYELYHSERSGCAKCHGEEGQGGGAPGDDYDDWNREQLREQLVVEEALGWHRLPITKAPARAITGTRLRGGDAPIDLFRRLHQGIAGTPMPAIGARRPGEESALTDEEVAALTDYVGSIMDVNAHHESNEKNAVKEPQISANEHY